MARCIADRTGNLDVGVVEQTDGDAADRRFSGILRAISVEVVPNAVADLHGGGVEQHLDVAETVRLRESADRRRSLHVLIPASLGTAIGAQSIESA